jgi:hypothetical protein
MSSIPFIWVINGEILVIGGLSPLNGFTLRASSNPQDAASPFHWRKHPLVPKPFNDSSNIFLHLAAYGDLKISRSFFAK